MGRKDKKGSIGPDGIDQKVPPGREVSPGDRSGRVTRTLLRTHGVDLLRSQGQSNGEGYPVTDRGEWSRPGLPGRQDGRVGGRVGPRTDRV